MTAPAAPRAVLKTHLLPEDCWQKGEPKLEEILEDPIVLARMRSTGVTAQDLRELCHQVRDRLEQNGEDPGVRLKEPL
jgi:hypothetical protein